MCILLVVVVHVVVVIRNRIVHIRSALWIVVMQLFGSRSKSSLWFKRCNLVTTQDRCTTGNAQGFAVVRR